jgi:hypothetical protein
MMSPVLSTAALIKIQNLKLRIVKVFLKIATYELPLVIKH